MCVCTQVVAGCSSFESGWCSPKCHRACDGATRAVDAPTLAGDAEDDAPPVFTEGAQKLLGAAAVALAIISLKFFAWDIAA
jgi:hypothetical protein